MNYAETFHIIARACRETHSACILIGGFAINYYHVTRQTVDVDFMITEEDFDKIRAHLEKAGFMEDCADRVFAKFKDKESLLMDIDFMFAGKDVIAKMAEDGAELQIAGEKFVVPSLDNLIALKLHSLRYNYRNRLPKDLPDIVNLIKANNIHFRNTKFTSLCLKYGNDEIYRKILEFLE